MSRDTRLFTTVTFLLNTLFEREEAFLTKRYNALIVQNVALGGSTDGFRHMGVIYSQLTGPGRQRGSYGTLHRSLIPEVGTFLDDRKAIDNDKDRVKMALSLVLRDCQTFQDIRDALPNGVVDLIPECRGLVRTREQAFTLADNPRSYTQYMAIREKIEFYVASRLLY